MSLKVLDMNCRTCQSSMLAYVNRELTQRKQRRVAQHLNQCDTCYAFYLSQRSLSSDLASRLPYAGVPSHTQLGQVWVAIQSDLSRPRPVHPRIRIRYGFGVLLLVLTLVVPWVLDDRQIVFALPSQPAPVTAATTETPYAVEATPTGTVILNSTNPAIYPAETPGALFVAATADR